MRALCCRLRYSCPLCAIRSWRVELELWRQYPVTHAENCEQRAHDGGGARDDNTGYDAHFSIDIPFRHSICPRPDFDDPPEEAEEEHHAQACLHGLLEVARHLRQHRRWQYPGA